MRALPDIERSVDEQEEELRNLRREVMGLEGRLGELGAIVKVERERKDDVVMGID